MLCAGVDEVGRGCIAGPVVACAVILPREFNIAVMDSKQCSAKRRLILSEEIKACALYAFGVVGNDTIDKYNIRNATLLAMAQAIHGLAILPEHVYIDGNISLPFSLMEEYSLTCSQETIVKGDSLNASISSASILAKVYRDTLMCSLSQRYPEYGFSKHKGYGTKEHYLAIKQYGACEIHRTTFAGVL